MIARLSSLMVPANISLIMRHTAVATSATNCCFCAITGLPLFVISVAWATGIGSWPLRNHNPFLSHYRKSLGPTSEPARNYWTRACEKRRMGAIAQPVEFQLKMLGRRTVAMELRTVSR